MDYITDTDDLLLDRWPWVENKAEILSGEAGMVANPGGTFMYIVWNQWEEEIYHRRVRCRARADVQCDMPFRRHMYLMDEVTTITTAPVAEILSATTAALAADQLTFIGTGLDADNPDGADGIVAYNWYSSIDGFIGSGQILSKVGDQLSIGTHIISLIVTDDEGVNSEAAHSVLVIAGGAFHTSMPMLRK